MDYFLKLVGLSEDPLPREWWTARPEIVDGVFFNRFPSAIGADSTLIYYAVGRGRGCVCGVAKVLGPATTEFATPESWSEDRRKRFRWRMPVKVLQKIPAAADAPKFKDFHGKRVGQGSYQRLPAGEAERMIAAIATYATQHPMKA